MLICLPFKYLQTNDKKDENKLPMNPYLMIVPALFDVLATILDSFALAYVSIISFPIINQYNARKNYSSLFYFT